MTTTSTDSTVPRKSEADQWREAVLEHRIRQLEAQQR